MKAIQYDGTNANEVVGFHKDYGTLYSDWGDGLFIYAQDETIEVMPGEWLILHESSLVVYPLPDKEYQRKYGNS